MEENGEVYSAREFLALKKSLGIELPEAKRSYGEPSRAQMARLLRFATDNGFVLNPMGYWYFVDSFNEFRHCPCDKNRSDCPCDQAAAEVQGKGKCLCQLFWRDYETYGKEKLHS